MRIRLLLLCSVCSVTTGWSQAAIPVNPASIDYFTYVTSQLDLLMNQGSPLFVNLGLDIVNGFAITVFILLLIRLAFQHVSHHHLHVNPWPILGFLFMVAGIDTMLRYYAVPLPGIGVSFSRLPSEITRQMSGFIDVTTYNLLLAKVRDILAKMQQPAGWFAFMDLFVYFLVFINMAFLEAILFLVTIFGFVFYGLTALVGPIFISFLLFPMWRHYFHAWLSTLLRFAFYRVAASALVFIWASAWLKFLNDVAGTDYTLAHLFTMIVPMILLNLAMFLTALRLPAWVDNVFSGSASAGHSGLVPGVVARMF